MSSWRDIERTLAETLSWDDARAAMRAVTAAHGGEAVYVPSRPVADRDAARAAVRAEVPPRDVAVAYGVSVRTVRRWVRGR